ncbi:hypothetical protein [Burkholderia lata]|uniref:hypothetical protein n=1 Tax=Burkholderia lata (strain ATCC 17760 / DSM 23089 / LMG 22485 / NCIMB 9086 / R18194 / 383) TaxID=482957 RepID=UPI00399BBCCF
MVMTFVAGPPALAGDLRPRFAFRDAAVLLCRERDRDQQIIDAPVERIAVLERHLQHGHAVASRRARHAYQHLALDAFEHARPAAAAGALRFNLQRHMHG